MRAGTVVRIDVGTVDSGDGSPPRPFVNTLSFGGYTQIVDARDRLRPRVGKWLGLAIALARELPRMEPLHLELDGQAQLVWLGMDRQRSLRPRRLRAVVAGAARRRACSTSASSSATAAWRGPASWSRCWPAASSSAPSTARRSAKQLTITSLDGPLRLAVDGETFDGGTRLTVAKRRRALAVAVPPT